ncbi:MAG: InlB B-repeat-containing protein [Clostridia bacterium]|nr:InlB B-repeat-containing protein [Clostridia bacterium]
MKHKRVLSLFLSIVMIMMLALETSAYVPAEAAPIFSADDAEVSTSAAECGRLEPERSSTRGGFKLGSEPENILYDYGKAMIGNTVYRIKDGSIVSSENDVKLVSAKLDSNNLNVLNNKLVFTCFDGNEASICSYDTKSGELRTMLKTGAAEITHMYVVNDAHIDYLADNAVYRYDIGSGAVEKLTAPADVFSFVPTYGGNIYAAGSAASASLFFESTELLDKVTYYSVEENSLIVTADSMSYKLALIDLIDYCSGAKATRDLCSIMTPYDFYGVLPVNDILSLDGHDCEHCEEEAKTAPAFRTTKTGEAVASSEETRGEPVFIEPNPRQQQMINKATSIVNFTWTPNVSFDKYTSKTVTNQSNSYFADNVSYGLPYSRPGKFGLDKIWVNGKQVPRYEHSYVFYDSIKTLDACKAEMETSGTAFNLAAARYRGKGYGALYGLDCSAFVSYAWGISKHASGQFHGDPECEHIAGAGGKTSSPKYLTMSNLARLLPGDAFVSAENHAILVTAICKEQDGSIRYIQTMEETPPSAVRKKYWNSSGNDSNTLNYLLNIKLKPGENDDDLVYPYRPYNIYRLKAVNTSPVSTGRVTFNAKPGVVSTSMINIAAGLKYGYFNNNTLPTPTRSGYTFKGWYTESSGGTKITANTIVQNGNNHTLYAQWIKNGSSASIQPSEYALIPDMPKKAFTKGEK